MSYLTMPLPTLSEPFVVVRNEALLTAFHGQVLVVVTVTSSQDAWYPKCRVVGEMPYSQSGVGPGPGPGPGAGVTQLPFASFTIPGGMVSWFPGMLGQTSTGVTGVEHVFTLINTSRDVAWPSLLVAVSV